MGRCHQSSGVLPWKKHPGATEGVRVFSPGENLLFQGLNLSISPEKWTLYSKFPEKKVINWEVFSLNLGVYFLSPLPLVGRGWVTGERGLKQGST